MNSSTLTMYMIQRKSDNAFYKNREGYHPPGKDTAWSKNMSECKPFRSKTGAKQSRIWNSTKSCPACIKSGYLLIRRYGDGFEYYDLTAAWHNLPENEKQLLVKQHKHKGWGCRVMRSEKEQPLRVVEVVVSIKECK
jgi:hypothetical protein